MEASLKPKKFTTFNILHFEIRYGLPVNFKVFSFLTNKLSEHVPIFKFPKFFLILIIYIWKHHLSPKKLTTFNILHFEIRYGLPVNFKVFSFLTNKLSEHVPIFKFPK